MDGAADDLCVGNGVPYGTIIWNGAMFVVAETGRRFIAGVWDHVVATVHAANLELQQRAYQLGGAFAEAVFQRIRGLEFGDSTTYAAAVRSYNAALRHPDLVDEFFNQRERENEASVQAQYNAANPEEDPEGDRDRKNQEYESNCKLCPRSETISLPRSRCRGKRGKRVMSPKITLYLLTLVCRKCPVLTVFQISPVPLHKTAAAC